ncbi:MULTISPECIES: ornithine--oxo-acid transaminase [Streptomyces]|uniref:ornithine aminotransferase n=2 Tax=Streptomyces TaxID=1883 RepID=A0ABU3J4Z8_9ACTN|nr:ornithine--oxo-acid transaminase [Streptomyces sp. McG7]MBT2908364.1 ornithine--oxo-acid transaminase [Streptomyces sp. McG8]MDQ0489609.1 ornithine--oxo-acid transaminase [Streptomyces thermodiastaticus]MDT6970107.1 ornithine--oxo-acid transaminase [Streptomyces thermocarboxydus]MDX3417482.1 ornithine--oxo-acid transaminase [Streptomyces sp. MD20-1-1]MXQ59721.1 ornithine--oxo-acid transaminase [Streptomyces sp. XHT-2]MYQ31014.1 ornithine--oxo-acid transaminase [Streptomyces sp. SID4956]MY
MTSAPRTRSSAELIAAEEPVLAHNYHPLPVVVARAEGAWVEDVEGRRYLDMLAGYSALNFGHRHPALIEAAHRQLDRLTLTSRAFHNDRLAQFAERLAALTGLDMVLPMNTGAEAVESGIKVARKWAYDVKGVPADRATIVVAADNFHGRTTTIVSFSTDETARAGFGPFTPGFRVVPYNDLAALEEAVDETTAAVLIEPIQGEAGVVIPDDGYLAGVRELTRRAGCLFVADEIQSGLGRTGRTLAVEHESVVPDVVLLGKALGGGIVPVSAVVARREVLQVLHPGEHGSTFGGNPLAAAVGTAVVELLETGEFQRRAAELGVVLREGLEALVGKGVTGFRSRGLWAGVDVDPALGTGREVSERLMREGILVKDTHGSTVRLAPPLTVTADELREALRTLEKVLSRHV